jgi:desulfoferrodoxin (superoxide reductase-like protein)
MNKRNLFIFPGYLYPAILFSLAILLLSSCKDSVPGDGQTEVSSRIQKFKEANVPIIPKAEYTKDAPEEWKGLEEDHIPIISFPKSLNKDLRIEVRLKNSGGDHYIEKMGIVDKNGKELATKTFRRGDKYFEALFSSSILPNDKSGLKVYAKCSLHDLWTTEFTQK